MQVRRILAQKSYLPCPELTEHTGYFLWKIKGSSVSSHQHTWIPLLVNVNTDNSLNPFWNKKNLCSNLATGSVLSQPFNYHCGLFSFFREGLTWAHKRSVPSVIVKRKLTILRKLWNLEKHLLQYTTCFIYFQKWTLITMLINRPRWSRFYQSNQHEAIELFFLLFSYLFLFFSNIDPVKVHHVKVYEIPMIYNSIVRYLNYFGIKIPIFIYETDGWLDVIRLSGGGGEEN